MPRRPPPLPPELAGRPFHLVEACRLGFGRRRLMAAGARPLRAGVWVGDDVKVTPETLVRAWAVGLAAGCVVTHDAAAVLLGLPLAAAADRRDARHVQLHAAATAPATTGPRAAGCTGHAWRLPAWQVTEVEGIATTSAARTFADLGASATWRLTDLVALGDAALRSGAAEPAELERTVSWAAGRRGVVRATAALALLDPRAESPRESRLRVWVARAGLPPPVPQLEIRTSAGVFVARSDLGWGQWRVAAEYLGDVHADTLDYDVARRRAYASAGWRVVDLTRVDGEEATTRLVRAALLDAGWRPTNS